MVLVAISFLSACQTKDNGPQTTTAKINTNNAEQKVNTSVNTTVDVSGHNKASDCWMIVDDQVYNVTSYIKSDMHPGGNNILKGCGKDATLMFDNDHKPETKAMLADYLVK